MLSECCQKVVSLYWAGLTEWPVEGCMSMPSSQHLPSVDICCVWKSCGVCLWLHLNPPSLRHQPCLAKQTSSSVCLACINCPCLARCLLLITLINFNSPGSHHRSCFQSGTHIHSHIQKLMLIYMHGQALMYTCMDRTLHFLQGVK